MLSTAYKKIQQFLFESKVGEQLGLMRILLCGTLLFLACSRQLNMDQYNIGSIIPRAEALSVYPDFYRPAFQYFFWPDQYAPYVHSLLIALLFLATVGLSNRFLMLATWVISQGFINRNYSMLFGADLIGTLFLFYIAFTDCNDRFTIKPYLRQYLPFIKHKQLTAQNENHFKNQLSSVFFRLMQFQIAVIYAYTGFEKFKGSTWWDGTALWTVFANPQFVSYDFTFLRAFPLFFTVGTFVTLIFEVYFPAMMMFKPARYIWLALGVFFHFCIGVLISLIPFSSIMVSTYFLFLDKSDIENCIRMIRSKLGFITSPIK